MIDTRPPWFVFLCLIFLSLPDAMSAGCPQGKYGQGCLSVCLCSWEGTTVCTSDVGRCICKEGYTGRLCEYDINECDRVNPPCTGRAHMFCVNTRGSYKCDCVNGYDLSGLGYCTPCPPYRHGKNCSEICSCIPEKTVYCEGGHCVCKTGWGGNNCELSLDDCAGVICPYETICVDGHRKFQCICRPGFLLIDTLCREYETIADAPEQSPGIGELVDVFVFYRLPEEYKYKSNVLPNFVYTLTIEASGAKLCQINFRETNYYLDRDVQFKGKLRINPNNYNFYSHVKVIFTEAIYSVVHLVPGSEEYYEMVLEFDVHHKSQSEIDCLLGMMITGTSESLRYAVSHKRQSYLSFQLKFNQTKDCGETPRVKWMFYSFSKRALVLARESCLNVEHVTNLDINALIEKSRESPISDHKSVQEILPKGTLPLGHIMICVEAFVHRNRQLRVTKCGYIEVIPSNIIEGKIMPNNDDIAWASWLNITLTADFVDPDASSELKYKWLCTAQRFQGDTDFECRDLGEKFEQLDYTQRELALPAGVIQYSDKITFTVYVNFKWRDDSWVHDQVTVWGETSAEFQQLPMLIDCEGACGDVIGAGKSVILKPRFPYQLERVIQIRFKWKIWVNNMVTKNEVLLKLIPEAETTVHSWDGYQLVLNGSALEPGFLYYLYVCAYVDAQEPIRVIRGYYSLSYRTQTWYSFRVEPPPSGSGCIISPTEGEAVFTKFTVKCLGYIDPVSRLPLTYKLYQIDRIGSGDVISTLIAFSGSHVMDKITLSTKGGTGWSTVILFVEVKNVKGTSIKVQIIVRLNTLDQAQALQRLIGNIKIQSGGQEDARTMKDIATVISDDSTADINDKVSVRQELLSNVQKLDSDSKDNIEQVSNVLSISVEKDNEIEPSGLRARFLPYQLVKSKPSTSVLHLRVITGTMLMKLSKDCCEGQLVIEDNGLNTAARLAKYLGKIIDDNIDVTKAVATTQVSALSKLMDVAANTGEQLSTLNLTNTTGGMEMLEENKQQSLLATQSISKIADVLLVALTGNNETIKMVTDFMNIYISSRKADSKSVFEAESDSAKFSLPSLDSGVLDDEIVDSEFEIFRKNPFGWTKGTVHGEFPVIKVNLARQSKKHLLKSGGKETFRFSKPADVFLNYNATKEDNYYNFVVKIVKTPFGDMIRKSSCANIMVKVSTERTTAMRIKGPDKLRILVKVKYTNVIRDFDRMYDEEMIEMPLHVPTSIITSERVLNRDPYMLFLPQLTQKQIKRNHPYFRMVIRLKVNQEVDTQKYQRLEIEGNNTEFVDEEPGEYYNVTIKATPHEMSCLHFDEQKADYLSDECRVSMYSNLHMMHCRCVVAAAYTGSVLIVPRLINPFDIELFLGVFKNPLVVSLVIAVWLMYIALIAWGRMEDQLDEIEAAVTVLDDNRDEHNYVYLICVVTGWAASSATSSNVFINLKGSWFQSENHVLQDPTRHLFRAGHQNWFMLTTDDDIGDLMSVVIWTDFSGAYPSWFLSSVYVQNLQTGEAWICPYNNWISVDLGIAKLQAEIPAMQEKAYSSNWTLQLVKKGQNDIRNDHLWFGIIMKTPYNKFTRVRRLTTALSLLQSLMILNHMFFGFKDKDDPGQFIEVFDQAIHVTSIIIGIQTAFIIFFLGIGISSLFNRVAPPPNTFGESDAKYQGVLDFLERVKRKAAALAHADSDSEDSDSSESESDSSETSSVGSDGTNSNTNKKSVNGNKSSGRRASSVDPQRLHRKDTTPPELNLSVSDNTGVSDVSFTSKPSETPSSTAFMLPWWFIYITWTMLAIYNLFLAYYIMLYGLDLGYKKSLDWAMSFFTGFLINVFIIQPVKVILMVFILVLIFQQGHMLKEQAPVAKLKDGIQLVQERKKYNRKYKTLLPKVICRVPLNTTEAKNVLERLALETAAREMLRDLFFYSIFMVSVLLVAYGHMDVRNQFLQTQYVKHRFLKTPMFEDIKGEGYASLGELENVRSAEDMWEYIKTIVAPEMLKDKGTISADQDIYLMGTARLRQVRSQGDSDACSDLPKVLGSLFFEETCSYSSSFYISEETNTYDGTWKVLSNISKDVIDDSPYVYRSSKELNGALVIGQHGIYSGGGYVIPFGQDDLVAMEDALTKRYNSDWIDHLTKCIFVEFTLYNAASDYFTNVIITFEFANFGVIYPSAFINSANLLNQELNKTLWLQLSEGFMVICTLFYTFVEIHSFRKRGFKKYFGNPWRCLEMFTIILTCAVGIVFFLRYYEFVEILKDFQKYGHIRFLNFEAVFKMHEQLHIYLAVLGGIVVFKMLKVTAFNPLVAITFRSFTNAQADLYGLLLLTLILFLAFAAMGILLFGKIVRSYRSVTVGLFTLLFFIMGESEYEDLVAADIYLGRIYVLMVTVASQYIIVNFFCSILQEGFELTRYMAFKREQETIKYMINRIQFYSGFGPKNVKSKKSKAK